MPNINKVVYGNQTLLDLTNSTLSSADQLAQGVTAYDRGGNLLTGTASGGGGDTNPTASSKDVNFIDYDGTIRYSYTASEAQALTELPANPTHTGLVAQGWNWTLAQIKSQLTNVGGKVWVGQMYITQSGDTEIDLIFADSARLSPILTIAVNGEVTVDWGDNTTADTVTGSSLTTRQAIPHTYASAGNYMMKIHVVSGSFTFYGSSSYPLLRKNTSQNENRVYANCIQAIRIGSGVTSIGSNAFYYCHSLASITVPSEVTSVGKSAFSNCYGMSEYLFKPTTPPTLGTSAFSNIVSDCIIYVPSASLSSYQAAENWSTYASYMRGE